MTTTNMKKIAIIGDGGLYPVVWGLGDTLEAALEDARNSDVDNCGWDSKGWASLDVGPEIVTAIEAGTVDVMGLGIEVKCDRYGMIDSAQIRKSIDDVDWDSIR